MDSSEMSLLFPEFSYNIRGAIYEVYKTLGPELLENVYQEALALEFELREIPFEAKKKLHLEYKGNQEPCLTLECKEGKWGMNDVSNELLVQAARLTGSMGYIVEFEE